VKHQSKGWHWRDKPQSCAPHDGIPYEEAISGEDLIAAFVLFEVSLHMNEKLAPREIVWRRQYTAQRYARHLSQIELNRRIRDIVLNLMYLNVDATIDAGPVTDARAIWTEKWAHMLVEMEFRHGPYPAGFTPEILHSEPFPNFASDLAAKAAKRMSSLGLKQGEVLIKFGTIKNMERLHDKGALRIQPATFFAKTDHNGAVRDDELTIKVSLALSRNDIVKVVRNPQDVPEDAPDQRFDATFKAPTDYWLYCMTMSVESRLFVDFKAESCVIVRNRQKFSQMIREATATALPYATIHAGPALYIDPLLPVTARIFVPFAKPFGYTYQNEYRFCWMPPSPAKTLAHIDLEIGSLKEFSELVVL
jgi:hypothetical protein